MSLGVNFKQGKMFGTKNGRVNYLAVTSNSLGSKISRNKFSAAKDIKPSIISSIIWVQPPMWQCMTLHAMYLSDHVIATVFWKNQKKNLQSNQKHAKKPPTVSAIIDASSVDQYNKVLSLKHQVLVSCLFPQSLQEDQRWSMIDDPRMVCG